MLLISNSSLHYSRQPGTGGMARMDKASSDKLKRNMDKERWEWAMFVGDNIIDNID